ncbi:glycosyltransferase [Glycomyces dulcitolivorans]|uniref:glycosyltransferase n=1 Tax=Glycomyces dulcitolivorans TaxID=2200759 RepID=UPI000DD3D0DC|nr:glycosyltransferase [Glycomyces dulcitolivorans]
MAERPRLLYLAFFFPPSRASGVFRARATANYFVEQGWDVTVLRGPDRFFDEITGARDDAMTATVDPRIEVAEVEMDYFRWETDVRRYGRFRGNFPAAARNWFNWKQDHVFPDKYQGWGANALREGLKRHRRQPFDLIVATGNPFASFGSAWALSKLMRRPFVVDYRDAWTLDQFENADMFPPEHPAWKWEKRILGSAAASLHVNDALRVWHARKYPEAADRMQVVLNGWDPDVVSDDPPTVDENRPLSFSFVGTLTHVQPIGSLLEGYRIMTERGAHAGAQLDFYGHIGFFAKTEGELRAQLGLDEELPGVTVRGPVPKPAIATAYAASDVLVFMTGGSKYVTTGKVFEYMATGKPIVSVHEKGCAAEELLRGYPLWFEPESLDPAHVAAAMADAGDAARKADPDTAARARAYAQSFTRYAALEPFEQWSRDLVAKRKG